MASLNTILLQLPLAGPRVGQCLFIKPHVSESGWPVYFLDLSIAPPILCPSCENSAESKQADRRRDGETFLPSWLIIPCSVKLYRPLSWSSHTSHVAGNTSSIQDSSMIVNASPGKIAIPTAAAIRSSPRLKETSPDRSLTFHVLSAREKEDHKNTTPNPARMPLTMLRLILSNLLWDGPSSVRKSN